MFGLTYQVWRLLICNLRCGSFNVQFTWKFKARTCSYLIITTWHQLKTIQTANNEHGLMLARPFNADFQLHRNMLVHLHRV